MKKVIVIGSNSFSGSHFIDLLLEKKSYSVVGISRSQQKDNIFLPYTRHHSDAFHFYKIDLNTQFKKIANILSAYKPDYVVNFAGLIEVTSSWNHSSDYLLTNTITIANLVQYLLKQKWLKRYVHISSAEVYGSCYNIDENAPLHPTSPYAVSKAAADMLVLAYKKFTNFPVVIIRSTNVYGPGQQLFRIVPKSIISIKKHYLIPLQGSGESIKSYIHIRDISLGELAIMEHGQNGEIYHLSPKSGISIRDLVKSICEQMHVSFKQSVINVGDRIGGQDNEYSINSLKARRMFGWKPAIDIPSGIEDVITWVNTHWSTVKHMPDTYKHKV
jgi:dTDP-glucose 4,6-dehydratase